MELLHELVTNMSVSTYMVKFFVSQAALIPIGVLYRTKLSPRTTRPTVRHVVSGTIGLAVIFFIFGWSALHMVFQAAGVYLILSFGPHNVKHKLAFVYAMSYMVWMHYCRLMETENMLSFYISFPMMPATQKLIIIILGVSDGQTKENKCLTDRAKLNMLRKTPSPAEFFGYVFYFAGIIVGPGFFYRDYIEFITGENMKYRSINKSLAQNPNSHTNGVNGFRNDAMKIDNGLSNSKNGANGFQNGTVKIDNNSNKPKNMDQISKNGKVLECCSVESEYHPEVTPTFEVVKKVLMAVGCFGMYCFATNFPLTRAIEDDFVSSHGIVYRILWWTAALTFHACRYYFYWILGEAIQNASGLGLYFVNGKPKWDLTCNVRLSQVHFSPNVRHFLNNWNLFTTRWLRYMCYERNIKHKVWVTYAINALWHGLEVGLYASFFTLALMTLAGRKVRRTIRPYFVGTRLHWVYSIITRVITHIIIAYCMGGFLLRSGWATFDLYTITLRGSLHLAAILVMFLPVPRALSSDLVKYKTS